MTTLSDFFADATATHWAVGHFNFATADVLRAIVDGAQRAGAPCVMVATSEGEADYIGYPEAVALVAAVRDASGFPVFLNADHHHSFERIKQAVDAGYDTVLFDGAQLPYEVNVMETRRVVEYANRKHAGMAVEGELGYLKGKSEVQESVTITPDDFTKPEQAADFVKRTGITRLASVFGNIHGIVTQQKEELDIGRLQAIAAALAPSGAEGVPSAYLVLHGASGLDDGQITAAIKAGITNIHFNTELRVAYTTSLKDTLVKEPKETTPYKLMGPAADAVRDIVEHKVKLFMSAQGNR